MVFIQEIIYLIKGWGVCNLDEYKLIGTHWIALYVNGNNESTSYYATYFDNFGVEHISKEINKFIGNKNIITSIYRTQAYDSTMCDIFLLDLLILC